MARFKKTVLEAYKKALEARKKAYAPHSDYQVGASVQASQAKQIYAGCNIENASYGGTICAERVALGKAISEGFQKFDFILVVTQDVKPAPPCGLCLQMMSEFFEPNTEVYLANLQGIQKKMMFKDFLPQVFKFKKDPSK